LKTATEYSTFQHKEKTLYNSFQAAEINTMLLTELLQLV